MLCESLHKKGQLYCLLQKKAAWSALFFLETKILSLATIL